MKKIIAELAVDKSENKLLDNGKSKKRNSLVDQIVNQSYEIA